MSMKNLKYLFVAELKDGTIYKQNKDDASIKEPPVRDENGLLQGKSCMFDIQEDIDNYNIKKFHLISQKMLGATYSVDLTTGEFFVNGVSFKAYSERPLPITPKNFKLIYFRDRKIYHTTPAIYTNPQSVRKLKDGIIEVINSKGERHVLPNIYTYWQTEEEDINGNMNNVCYLQPNNPPDETKYILGWQCEISGKNYQQKIEVV